MRDLNELGNELVERMPDLEPTVQGMSEVFADIVFSYRVRNKLTQKQLADLANVAPKTIHRIEGGSGGITDTTYQKVFDALDIPFQDAVAFFFKTQGQRELTTV
jgi:transcriptional regulator with XRE-family HTH domain